MTLRAEKALVSLLLLSLLGPGFFWLAGVTSARSVSPPGWLVTPLDQAFPLTPAAVWVYVSWYPASALVLLARRETFRRAYMAYGVAFLACVAGYLLFPVTIARPILSDAVGISPSALGALYGVDPPVNLFPSFHAAVAAILLRLRPPARWVAAGAWVWFVALCAACVLTKQHYVLDVIAGLAVGGIAVTLVDVARSAVRYSARLTPRSLHTAESETADT